MTINWRRALIALAMLVSFGALQACNTVSGAGEDLKAAGHGIEKSADKNKTY